MMKKELNSQIVQSLARGLDIIEFAAQREGGVSLNEVAEKLDLSTAAAHNLTGTLCARGYLQKSVRPVRYHIGHKMPDMVRRFSEHQTSANVAVTMKEMAASFPNWNFLYVVPASFELVLKLRMDPTRPGRLQHPLRTFENPYILITCVCLLAFLSEEDRLPIFRRYPFEEFANAETPNLKEFLKTLQKIRQIGHFTVEGDRPRTAYPVYDSSGQIIGALGMSPSADYHPAGSEFTKAKNLLSEKLSTLAFFNN